MAEDSQKLHETLTRLHDQLRSTKDLSPEVRALLTGVVNDIQTLLEPGARQQAAAARSPQHESILARLGSAEREFEATHPTLAGIVGSIIDALGRMGI